MAVKAPTRVGAFSLFFACFGCGVVSSVFFTIIPFAVILETGTTKRSSDFAMNKSFIACTLKGERKWLLLLITMRILLRILSLTLEEMGASTAVK